MYKRKYNMFKNVGFLHVMIFHSKRTNARFVWETLSSYTSFDLTAPQYCTFETITVLFLFHQCYLIPSEHLSDKSISKDKIVTACSITFGFLDITMLYHIKMDARLCKKSLMS